MLGNPFDAEGKWHKAALHVHTTDSDGDHSPLDTVKLYARQGYDVVCITDHNGSPALPDAVPGITVLPGAEVLAPDSTHIVVLGLGQPGIYQEREDVGALFERGRKGELALILAHPYWSHLKLPQMMDLAGVSAVEVYNTTTDVRIGRGFSDVHLDEMLDLGRTLWVAATDDCHFAANELGRAWTMIKLTEPTPQGLVRAIQNGSVYASTGPAIDDLVFDGDQVRIVCDPVARIDLIAGPGGGWGRSIYGQQCGSLTEAEWKLPDHWTGYVRVQCLAPDGRRAWTNPFKCQKGKIVPWAAKPYEWKTPD